MTEGASPGVVTLLDSSVLPESGSFRSIRPMNLMKERSRGEIILFAAAVFGVWLSIWAVIFVSGCLEAIAVLTTLICLVIFALRASD